MERARPLRAITFDCYGTLIDWERGMWPYARKALEGAGLKLARAKFYAAWEPIQFAMIRGRYRPYREILEASLRDTLASLGGRCKVADARAFAGSMGAWKPFADVPAALGRLKNLYTLAPISNTDDDFLAASAALMGNPFHHHFTAQKARAYKPSTRPFEVALKTLRCHPSEVLHVAFGHRYDLGPARACGLKTAWLNRSSEALPDGFAADFELSGMEQLVWMATKAC